MPSRILKDSLCTSETIDILTAEEERLFYRIIVQCDDYGRMEANPLIIRSRCYPLKSDVITCNQVFTWLNGLKNAGLLKLYLVDGKQYLQVTTWEKHQQIRAKRSKYPSPDDQNTPSEINCNQMITNVPVFEMRNSYNVSNNISDSVSENGVPPEKTSGEKYNEIYNHWNNKNIIVHKNMTTNIQRAVLSALKDYSVEEIKTAITNYALILHGDEYFWNYKWTLVEFLGRRNGNNIERFLDLEVAKSNFSHNGKKQSKQTPTRKNPLWENA